MKTALAEVFVGGSVGLFLGLLVGMSVSPVVGIVVSGITGILAAFLGLAGTPEGSESSKARKLLQLASRARMIAFGLAAAAGLFLGLWIRTHNLLSPSRAADVQAWTVAGWSPEEARALHVYGELGLIPEGLKAGEGETKPGTGSVLYGTLRNECRDLEPRRYKDANESLNAWELEKGVWGALAEVIRKSGNSDRTELVASAWSKLCSE